jgi:hypothetical protein
MKSFVENESVRNSLDESTKHDMVTNETIYERVNSV